MPDMHRQDYNGYNGLAADKLILLFVFGWVRVQRETEAVVDIGGTPNGRTHTDW